MKIKVILSILFVIMMCTNICAQSISVVSFKLLPNDLTANTNGSEVLDQNGDKAALIKVVTTQTGFTFEGGALGITKVKQDNGEYWVYIPQKSKKITIKHPQLSVLRDYVFPCAIEAAKTYEMVLASGSVQTVIKKDIGGNFMAIKVMPENAAVYIDGMLQQNDANGEYSVFLGYGEHSYRIEAAGYTPQTGIATISRELFNLNVRLESSLATLSIICPTDSAQIFLNKQLKGTNKWTGNVSAGRYLIEAVKYGYQNIIENIIIAEKENKTITLQALQPIYGILKVNVRPIGSTIEIDGKNVGKTPVVIDNVIIGNHTVKVIASNGNSILKNISLKENEMCSIEDIIPDLTIDQLVELAKNALQNKEYKKVFEYASKAETSGNEEAQYILGKYYSFCKNWRKAFEYYKKAADQGFVQAQFNLAEIYDYGKGIIANGKIALELYKKAAEQGCEEAQYRLGQCYEYGYNRMPQSATEAEKWYCLAAEHGNMERQYELGNKYMNYYSIIKSYEKAVKWYRLAAEQGHMGAQYCLGNCYMEGTGVNQSHTEAVKWYRLAAEQGDADAQYGLGKCYESGSGVAQSYTEAMNWYKKSAKQGNQDAIEALNNTTEKIDYIYGGKYNGDKINGIPHGMGRMTYSDGSYYEGNWKNGVKQGKGKFYDPETNVMQEGIYVNGICSKVTAEYKIHK